MQKKEVKEAILRALEQSGEPLNFEKLFENTKNIQKCSRKTFSDYLHGLTQSEIVKREEITTRNVRYTINKRNFERFAKISQQQKDLEESLKEILEKIRTFSRWKKGGREKTILTQEIRENILAILEFIKAYTFFKTSGIVSSQEMEILDEIQKKLIGLTTKIFSEIRNKDESSYTVMCLNLYLKIFSEFGKIENK